MSRDDVQVAYGSPPVPPEGWDNLFVDGVKKLDDGVDHPEHYGGANNPYEAIKVIEAWNLGFNLGNCAKYISRHERKGTALQDLKKARWYLDREIQKLENE